jgi:hypothetical protein
MHMQTLKLATLATLGLLTTATVGCGEAVEEEDGLQLVIPGKDDNYYSNVAREYELTGTIDVQLNEEARADDEVRDELIEKRLTAVGLYLTAFLTDKFEGIDINDNGEIDDDEVFFRNVDYGGFQAMVRNYSLETDAIDETAEDRVSVTFTIDVGGPPDLVDQLVESGARNEEGTVEFDLFMPQGATSDPDAVARGEIRGFDPTEHSGDVEIVELAVEELPEISDAYPHFADFMSDGVYDITLFYGHDYNTPRSDLRESQDAFRHLVRRGFEAPAESWETLGAESGPFVKTVRFRGEDARIEVRLFHGDMFLDDREAHKATAIAELTDRDVFFYNGHAGPYYGLYLDGAHEADVDYLEIAELELRDKQQLFVAQGCQTYSQYADMLYANPAKDESNLDAITTVNYSYGMGTLELLDNLTGFDSSDDFAPSTFYEIVSDLNSVYWNSAKSVFYGVMGLDGNPQLHPAADLDTVGAECAEHSDCGTTTDANLCLDSQCVARTLGESCPSGTEYAHVVSEDTIIGGVCH